MYEPYWQLDEKPFETGCDPKYFYPGESHQAALLKLRYAVESHRGGAMLAGASGLGKSLLVLLLRSMLPEETFRVAHVVFPQMRAAELLAYLADELSGQTEAVPGTPGVNESVRRIQTLLTRSAEEGRHTLVVIDEAQLITEAESLDALRLLMNFEVAGRPASTLLLVGQPGVLTTLDQTPHLEERIDVKCLLRPFSPTETASYVGHRLRIAGASRDFFTEDALEAVHNLSQGVPRRINRLCDLALLIGFAEEFDSIAAAHVESIERELVTVVPE